MNRPRHSDVLGSPAQLYNSATLLLRLRDNENVTDTVQALLLRGPVPPSPFTELTSICLVITVHV